jgi:CSLREA domain-containing protein
MYALGFGLKGKGRAKWLLALGAGALALLAGTANAATHTVNTAVDEQDGSCSDGDCSLRDAVALAVDGDTISFHSSLDGVDVLLGSQITLDKDLTIIGSGMDSTTLNAQDLSSHFLVDAPMPEDTTVEIRDLTLKNGLAFLGGAVYNRGTLTVEGVRFLDNDTIPGGSQSGGGIYNAGALMVVGSEFTNNAIGVGGGGGGGAIASGDVGPGATVTISGSRFTNNTAIHGGAIWNIGAPMTIESSTFEQNHAQNGGGVFNEFGTMTVTASTFSDNTADLLGAGFYGLGDATITNSTFSSNDSSQTGGGLALFSGTLTLIGSTVEGNTALVDAGGIVADHVDMRNSTVSGNTALEAPGVALWDSGASITNSTITGNVSIGASVAGVKVSSGLGIYNSIVAGNISGNPDPDISPSGCLAESSNNIIGAGGCLTHGVNGNIVGVVAADVFDLTLADNGGPTKTHALVSGSVAIDAGSNAAATAVGLTTDQRSAGHSRFIGGTTDIGAFEFGAADGGTPELDHYLAYSAHVMSGSRFTPRDVALETVFTDGVFKVQRPATHYNPVDKNSEGIESEDLHLVGYRLKALEASFSPATVQGENQFEEFTLDLRQQADLLLVPSTKDMEGEAPEDEEIFEGDRHFLCYPVSHRFTLDSIQLRDQFMEEFTLFRSVRAARLCAPAEKTLLDEEGIPDDTTTVGDLEGEDYLVCYRIVGEDRGSPVIRRPWIRNQFGGLRLIVSRTMQLCVPSTLD